MKKKVITAILTAAMAVSMVGCGSSSGSAASASSDSASGSSSEAAATSEAAETTAASETTTSDDGTYTIDLIMKIGQGSAEYFDYLAAGAQAYVDENPNVTVNVSGPSSYTAYDEQMNNIETLLGTDADAFIISPLQSDTVAKLIADETRPIIAVDTDIDADNVLSFVGTGNESAASEGGKEAVELAKAAGWTDVTAIALTGAQGDQTHEARVNGFKEGVEEAGGTFLADEMQYCDASADKAANAMEAILQRHPEGVSCILCTNDDMAMSAARIAKESGNDAYANTIFCGFDGSIAACEGILDGSLSMTVAQSAYDMGYMSVEAAVKALEGETLDDFIDSGATIITPDNAQEKLDEINERLGK